MVNAIATRGTNVAARTSVAASWSDRDAAEKFSAAVVRFSAGDLAKAARRTKAAAKGWKDESRAPSLASVRNMALSLPSVQQFLADECGYGNRAAQAVSVDAVIRWAREWRSAQGMEGDIARAVLREVAGAPAPEQVQEPKDNVIELSSYTPDGALGDLLEWRRA